MCSENSLEMASRTVSDASQLSLNAESGAETLMRDVNIAREDLGSNSCAFKDYDSMVVAHLEKNGTLPMLSLGHAKNSFDKLDLDGSGDLTKDELIIARDHAGSKVEERMIAMLCANYQDVRAAHESNKYVPFMEDKKGITLDDINAKLNEGKSNMDQTFAPEDYLGTGIYRNWGEKYMKFFSAKDKNDDWQVDLTTITAHPHKTIDQLRSNYR
jgi:hypothetical protein